MEGFVDGRLCHPYVNGIHYIKIRVERNIAVVGINKQRQNEWTRQWRVMLMQGFVDGRLCHPCVIEIHAIHLHIHVPLRTWIPLPSTCGCLDKTHVSRSVIRLAVNKHPSVVLTHVKPNYWHYCNWRGSDDVYRRHYFLCTLSLHSYRLTFVERSTEPPSKRSDR